MTVAVAVDGVTFTADAYLSSSLTAGAPCTATSATVVHCPLPSALTFATGDGNDQVTITAAVTVPVTLDGGSGDDVLLGGREPDAVHGGSGDDALALGDGADDLHGDGGDDTVRVTGLATGGAVTVALDDAADDGRRGEGANVHRHWR